MNNKTAYIAFQLRAMHAEDLIASVFTDPENPDDFIAGHIRAVNLRQLLMETVTPYGRLDGYFVIRLSCVLEALHDITYSQRLSLLMQMNNAQPPAVLPMPEPDADYMRHVLSWAQEHERIVTIWTKDDAATGFVLGMDDLRLTLGLVDFMGKNPVPTQFVLRDIELLSVCSEEERMYEQLAAIDMPLQ